MGQNLCSNNTQLIANTKQSALQFQFGQDQKEGRVEHDQKITYKNVLNLQPILESCIEKLKTSKLMYKDPLMPTERLVLKSISKQTQNKHIQTVFMKPYRFLNDVEKGKHYNIFPNNDSNSDYILVKDEVMQYFGVILCFLADHPNIISDIILTESNSYGILAVKMNIAGKQTVIIMDDYVLCTGQEPLFVQPVKNIYLWPNIIQKAWLKITGFTQKVIEKSTPQQVFESFINYPYKKFMLQQVDEESAKMLLQNYLYKVEREYGYVLTTKKQPKLHIGISGKKYLYLIGSFAYESKRMFYIRNPCGRFNFRGQYDEIDQKLTQIIKKELEVSNIQDGNFILQESQFLEQIGEFAICYYAATLRATTMAVQLENNSEIMIQTELKAGSQVSLCFRQQSHRKSDTHFSPITYHMFNMSTGQVVAGYQNTEGCFGPHNSCKQSIKISQDLFPEVIKKLPQSKYLIRLKKKDKKKHYFGIQSMLIACSVMEMKFDMKNQSQFSDLFFGYLKMQGRRNLQQRAQRQGGAESKNKNTQQIYSTFHRILTPIDHIVFMVGDLICIYIEYISTRQQEYKIQISFPELKNLQMIHPQIDLNKTSVLPNMLGPSNKEEIIAFEKISLTEETELGYFQLEAF